MLSKDSANRAKYKIKVRQRAFIFIFLMPSVFLFATVAAEQFSDGFDD